MSGFILAVADDLLFTSKITGALEPAGWTVKVIADTTAAISQSRSNTPNLAIVDLGIQRGDPFELIRALKSELNVPVLAYTRHTDTTGQQKALDLGCDKVVARSEFFGDIIGNVGSVYQK